MVLRERVELEKKAENIPDILTFYSRNKHIYLVRNHDFANNNSSKEYPVQVKNSKV